MRREQRLSRGSQIAAVFEHGKAWTNEYLALRAMPNGLDFSRFTFIASKKVGKKAVVRNRVKRLLRESMRANPVRSGWDLVAVARSRAAEAPYREIERAVQSLLRRSGLREQT